MRQLLIQETSGYASPTPGRRASVSPMETTKLAWFLRVCGMFVLVASLPTIMHKGWPHGVFPCGSLAIIFDAIVLLVMSFLYVTFGRTKLIVAAATMVLGLWAVGFSLAVLVLPHP